MTQWHQIRWRACLPNYLFEFHKCVLVQLFLNILLLWSINESPSGILKQHMFSWNGVRIFLYKNGLGCFNPNGKLRIVHHCCSYYNGWGCYFISMHVKMGLMNGWGFLGFVSILNVSMDLGSWCVYWYGWESLCPLIWLAGCKIPLKNDLLVLGCSLKWVWLLCYLWLRTFSA
jgi:hypothetical protein